MHPPQTSPLVGLRPSVQVSEVKDPHPHQVYNLLSLIKRFCHPPLSAEDIAQDIKLRAFVKQIPITYALVRSRCYDSLRKLRRERLLLLTKSQTLHNGDLKPLVSFEETTLLSLLFTKASLPLLTESLLYQHFYLGHNFTQLSKETNIPVEKVSFLIHQALIKLRETARSLKGKGV